MAGEELNQVTMAKSGFVGDRGWAVYNLEADEIQGGRKLPALMQLQARYVKEPTLDNPGVLEVIFPNQKKIEVSQGSRQAELADFLNTDVKLCPIEPATNLNHYRLATATDEADLRKQFDLAPEEELPDFSTMSLAVLAQLKFFATPPGTYFDAYPLHILTTGALRYFARETGLDQFHARRYRPNIVLKTQQDTIEEFDWAGCVAHSNGAEIQIENKTVRCSVPGRQHTALPAEKKVVQAVAKLTNRFLGVYASVKKEGTLRVGDKFEIQKDLLSDVSREIGNIGSQIKSGLLKFLT